MNEPLAACNSLWKDWYANTAPRRVINQETWSSDSFVFLQENASALYCIRIMDSFISNKLVSHSRNIDTDKSANDGALNVMKSTVLFSPNQTICALPLSVSVHSLFLLKLSEWITDKNSSHSCVLPFADWLESVDKWCFPEFPSLRNFKLNKRSLERMITTQGHTLHWMIVLTVFDGWMDPLGVDWIPDEAGVTRDKISSQTAFLFPPRLLLHPGIARSILSVSTCHLKTTNCSCSPNEDGFIAARVGAFSFEPLMFEENGCDWSMLTTAAQ